MTRLILGVLAAAVYVGTCRAISAFISEKGREDRYDD